MIWDFGDPSEAAMLRLFILFSVLEATSIAQPSVVSTTTTSDEILHALAYPRIKSYSELVSDPRYSNLAAIVKQPGSFGKNLEKLVSLKPDLVILSPFNRPAYIETITRLRQPYLKLPPIENFTQLWQAIALISEKLDFQKPGEQLIRDLKEKLNRNRCRQRPGFYYAPDFMIPGRDTMVSAILNEAGIKNLVDAHYVGWRKLSAEQWRLMRPEVVVVSSAHSNYPHDGPQVIVIPEALLSATSPYSVDAVISLRRALCQQ